MNVCGERVKLRREELQLTQSELCGRLATVTHGIWNGDRRDIHRVERGTRKVSDAELIALTISLETTPQWLLIGEGTEEEETGFARPMWTF
ncbi:hypothetical protein CCAX7_59640 [Capsulimonas corticalis]|uniref:Uncharacterized protein n=1 Tax=Capsulimonas corticalis TaxID=2219043 RepID=A0A402CZP0_9BACT|nr:hypothetical protein CCAX7_59640 [Capsulimonas corticalis]